MFLRIPWDVWCAGALLIATVLSAIFGLESTILVTLYAMVCAYIVVSTFKEESEL